MSGIKSRPIKANKFKNLYVEFELEAYQKMRMLVDKVDVEVSWFGIVNWDTKSDKIKIVDTVFYEQECKSVHTQMLASSIGNAQSKEIMDAFKDNNDCSDEEEQEILNRLNTKFDNMRLWGHSHVNMPTSASGTDDSTAEAFGNDENIKYMIRLITNKRNEYNISLYLYDSNLIIDNIPYKISYFNENYEMLDKQITEEIGQKIKKPQVSYNSFGVANNYNRYNGYNGYNGYGGGYRYGGGHNTYNRFVDDNTAKKSIDTYEVEIDEFGIARYFDKKDPKKK